MSDEEIWDGEMTMAEFKRLDPALQRKRIDTSLMRKVAELQRWAAKGVPQGFDWRKVGSSRVKLRQWHDPKKRLWAWSDDTPDHPRGRNRGLIAKWRKARDLLRVNRSATIRPVKEVLAEKVQALELQNILLIAEKSSLEMRLRRAEEILSIKDSTVALKRKRRKANALPSD
ncbi:MULTISPECIES: hypothetical protein [unclassified Rhizobium]|uniref:hypothetical protein n=1 Tax=unclassified Rhizobium TaxID=2613769 RepID=UPI001AD97CDC|nr:MULTISPECIES: hypothetical protein [unclassified Rhizobium]MBO9124918.1 hypothetical protein [Rhizobium sp. 16-488-2b]MBO9175503.1 hypothetical protein [Rhizobium sp. 16-488-2a]